MSTLTRADRSAVLARVGWLDIALRSNHILEQVGATNCCNEYSNQLTGGKFFRTFKDHYGLQPHDIEFFAEHGEAGKTGSDYIAEVLKDVAPGAPGFCSPRLER
jgi:hypothetical protein